jgi:hypothetical protein
VIEGVRTVAESGALLFARFAYPPNSLGYCGPDDSASLLEYAAAGHDDPGLRDLARGFEGAWPYLRLIAAANHLEDPLDPAVVEAYWIGNTLLERVTVALMGGSLDERFRRHAGRGWEQIVDSLCAGSVPHHNFHVFSIYPWVGMLRGGLVDAPLRVLDRCRVRWGQVVTVTGDTAVTLSSPLSWDGSRLRLADPVLEAARCSTLSLQPGDWVALHWDWACARLAPDQLSALQSRTRRELQIAASVPRPAAAALLG